MAKRDSKSVAAVNKAVKTERYYTVGYVPQRGKRNPPPAINLKGRWLEALGFFSGQPVLITVEHGRLVIQPEIKI
ncbi:SymE family type I addiction module toxin [Yersinia similis]|uniref:SymE family type I addiction module toxin n=1 Tax=Yersinia similis TaxID=367190 RepID=UPI00384D332C